MKTKQTYLENSYQKSISAKVIEIVEVKDGVTTFILDETICYPMGGGQPTDQGTISLNGLIGEIFQVMIVNGEIHHFAKNIIIPENSEVQINLNWERRYKNMRTHSAGHVIDFSLYLLGISPKSLTPLKGDHGKKPFIVYSGKVVEDFKAHLQSTIDKMIEDDLTFACKYLPKEEIEKNAIYLQPNLPVNKPLRALTLEGVGTVADGGTQVNKTSEVENCNITEIKIDEAQNTTTIYYSIN